MASATKDQGSLEKGLKDLNLTNEELNRFEKAFKDPEFLKLFEEYAKEVSDPKVKAETDQYLRQLEEQGRAEDVYGKGVQLLTPKPGLVLKTKVMGAAKGDAPEAGAGAAGGKREGLPPGQKVFINVCTNDKVDRYSLKEGKDASGRAGQQLSIPISTGPVRQGTDKQGQPAAVYDVVVHPETLEFAVRSTAVMNTLAEMALEQVETVSRSRLSRGWRRLNSRFKATEGCSEPPVMCVRSGEGGEAVGGRLKPRADVPGLDVPGAKSAAAAAAAATPKAAVEAAGVAAEGGGGGSAAKGPASRSAFSFDRAKGQRGGGAKQEQPPEVEDPAQPGYRHPDGSVTPEWALVHRGQTDLAAAWGDAGRGLALDTSVPKELLLRVTLPEVASAAAVDLDVGERRLSLKVPGKYGMEVTLPYSVDENKGKAKFDKARKQLEITLPVVPPPPPPPRPPAVLAAQVEPTEDGQEAAGGVAAAAAGSAEGRDAAAAETGESSEASTSSEQQQQQLTTARQQGSARTTAEPEGKEEGEEWRRAMTENERKWRELHERRAPASGGDGDGGGGATAAAAAPEVAGAADAAAPSPSSSSSCAAASCPPAASVAAGGAPPPAAVAAAAPEPTVMLRPRLRRDLVMELD